MTIKKTKQTKNRYKRRFSISQINTYIDCPRKYKFRYIDKIKSVGNENLIIGSAHHSYFEAVLENRIMKMDLTPSQRDELRIDICDKMVKDMKGLKQKIDITKNKKIFDLLTKKWDEEVLPGLDPLEVEKEYKYKVDGYDFILYVDLINVYDGRKEIIDWKVVGRSKNQRTVDNLLQLSFYALATGIEDVAICSLVKNLKNPKIDFVRSTRGKAEQEWCESIINGAVRGINMEYFPYCSTENFLCCSDYCDHWDRCRGKKLKENQREFSWKK